MEQKIVDSCPAPAAWNSSKRTSILAVTASLMANFACQQASLPKASYPATRKDSIVDDYFGTKIPAPYRWMEDLDSKEVADWVAAENRVTFDYLAKLPMREHFRQRITQIWNYPKTSIPTRQGGRYFYSRNSGLQQQSPVYMRSSVAGAATLVLDPNVLSADGSISLAQWTPSHDGRLLAYGLSQGGADWRTVRVRDVDSGKELADEIHWMRFSDISWTNDNKGFFYAGYPAPPKGKELEAALSGQTLYYHLVGTPQSQDRLIYRRPDLATWFLGGGVTEDGRYLLITLNKGSDNNNRLYYSVTVSSTSSGSVSSRVSCAALWYMWWHCFSENVGYCQPSHGSPSTTSRSFCRPHCYFVGTCQ